MGTDHQESLPGTGGAASGQGEREWATEERERIADEREQVAEDRERVAEEREMVGGGEGEGPYAPREGPGQRESSYEHIERVSGLLAASQERLGHSRSALRQGARAAWEQAFIEREIADSARLWQDVDHVRQEARVARLREMAMAAISALADAHDVAAGGYERHAQPQQALEHRRHAQRARQAMRDLAGAAEPTDDEGRG